MCCIYIGTKASRSSIIWMWFKFPWFVYPSIKIHWKTGIFSYASWAYGALWRQLSKPAILIIIQHINRHIREQTNQLCSWTTWARLAARRPWPRIDTRQSPVKRPRARPLRARIARVTSKFEIEISKRDSKASAVLIRDGGSIPSRVFDVIVKCCETCELIYWLCDTGMVTEFTFLW